MLVVVGEITTTMSVSFSSFIFFTFHFKAVLDFKYVLHHIIFTYLNSGLQPLIIILFFIVQVCYNLHYFFDKYFDPYLVPFILFLLNFLFFFL